MPRRCTEEMIANFLLQCLMPVEWDDYDGDPMGDDDPDDYMSEADE